MNYVDAIDVGTSTPPANAEEPPAQTLNEEVNEVIGRFNNFWGGFRKQASIVIVPRHRLRYFDNTILYRLRVR